MSEYNILNLPIADFQAYLGEMRSAGRNTDDLVRQYRSHNSPFSAINSAADEHQQGLAESGRRSVGGGFLSKEAGTTGWDALKSVDFEGMGGLLGAVQALGQAFDAPYSAARNLIPKEDMTAEALGTAGVAMSGGGLAARPSGSVGMGGSISDVIKSKYPDVKVDLFGGPEKGYELSKIVVPKDGRSAGVGTQIMDDITRMADEQGAKVSLTPDTEFGGTSVSRLKGFYKRFGFVENKGKNKDFSTRNTMHRTPQSVSANASQSGGLLGAGLARKGAGEKGVNKTDLDPLGYGNIKMDDYLDSTDLGLRDLGENLPRIQRSWEDLEGGLLLPFYGDRTSRGYELDRINDTKFSRPVYTEGGFDFMRGPANQSDNAVWASAKHIIDRIEGASAKARKEFPDTPIYGVTGSMAPDGVDFANFSGEAMAELVSGNRGGINLDAAKSFDERMSGLSPTFPGLLSDDLRDWAGSAPSEVRKSFIRGLDTKPMRQAGVPSAGLARYGVTEPSVRDVPSGQFGSAAAELRPGTPLMYNEPTGNDYRTTNPHTTYNTQMQGDYVGQLPLIPQRLAFPDAYGRMEHQLDKRGNLLGEANKTYAIKTQLQPQPITPRMIDGIMDYLSRGRDLQ